MDIRTQEIETAVKAHYGAVASSVLHGESSSCCGTAATSCCGDSSASTAGCGCTSACCGGSDDPITRDLYQIDELEGLPLKAALASRGCGNPTALTELRPGETVLDLGSGGGIDVLLSARRVGPTGFAYGLDLTDEMLELARHNAAEAGATNVSFLKGDMAAIPLPAASIDTIISNCVINLAADKDPVLREAFRVLKPGGRFAVSDIVIHGDLPELLQPGQPGHTLLAWAGCIAGALTATEYEARLAAAGFTDIELEVTRRYSLADLGDSLPDWAAQLGPEADRIAEMFASTFVRARKPA